MKTNYKYIYYREDKGLYTVKLNINNKQISKTVKDLPAAIALRNQFLNLSLLNKNKDTIIKQRRDLITFNDYYLYYLNDIKETIKPSTLHKYNLTFLSIKKYLGLLKFKDISSQQYYSYFSALQKNGYSSRYIFDKIARLKQVYKYFNINSPLDDPLFSGRKKKFMKTIGKKRRAFTSQEKDIFIKTAKKSLPFVFYAYFYSLFLTGCRKSELLALKWEEVSLDRKEITIKYSITKGIVNGVYTEIRGTTKTGQERTIPISDKLYDILLALIDIYGNNLSSNYVFNAVLNQEKTSHKVYEHISISAIDKAYCIVRDEAKIDKSLCIHSIRHTVCSELVDKNVPLPAIKELLGWSSYKMLLQVYAHSNTRTKTQAINLL